MQENHEGLGWSGVCGFAHLCKALKEGFISLVDWWIAVDRNLQGVTHVAIWVRNTQRDPKWQV